MKHLMQEIHSTKNQVTKIFKQYFDLLLWNTLCWAQVTCTSLCELNRHSKCINHQWETLYEELIGEVKFDLGPKIKVKSNIVSFKSPVAAYLS